MRRRAWTAGEDSGQNFKGGQAVRVRVRVRRRGPAAAAAAAASYGLLCVLG